MRPQGGLRWVARILAKPAKPCQGHKAKRREAQGLPATEEAIWFELEDQLESELDVPAFVRIDRGHAFLGMNRGCRR